MSDRYLILRSLSISETVKYRPAGVYTKSAESIIFWPKKMAKIANITIFPKPVQWPYMRLCLFQRLLPNAKWLYLLRKVFHIFIDDAGAAARRRSQISIPHHDREGQASAWVTNEDPMALSFIVTGTTWKWMLNPIIFFICCGYLNIIWSTFPYFLILLIRRLSLEIEKCEISSICH